MRHATRLLTLLLCVAGLVSLRSDAAAQGKSTLSAIGFIDYMRPPRFKVGDWVRYRRTGSSESGNVVNSTITILISGEEKFWGEDCFWIETWTQGLGEYPSSIAMLMSYSAFGDSLWRDRLELYHRKVIFGLDEETKKPLVQLLKRADLAASRRKEGAKVTRRTLFDTLGTDTVMVPKGTYTCERVRMKRGIGNTSDKGDSTTTTEVWRYVTVYYRDEIPITNRVCEKQEDLVLAKAWRIGKSSDVVTSTVDHGFSELRLEDYGSGGLTPKLTPMASRQPIARTGAPPGDRARKPAPHRRSG
jgi:hypothetical protein